MYINFTKKIYSGQPFIPFFLFFNVTENNKPSANKEKLTGNNKKGKQKDKHIANKKKSTDKINGDSDIKSNTDMKSLIGEKNMNQDSNTYVQK